MNAERIGVAVHVTASAHRWRVRLRNAYNRRMTLEEHLACPKCGYDLHGIPEDRCPECGFGYDGEALRSWATSTEWARLAAARDVIVRSTIAAALAIPATCSALGLPTWAQILVAAVAYVAAYLTWLLLTDAYRGVVSIPSLLTRFVAIPVAICYLLPMPLLPGSGRGILFAISTVMLALAWSARLRNWPMLSPTGNLRSEGLRRSAIRHSDGATFTVMIATLIVFLALAL